MVQVTEFTPESDLLEDDDILEHLARCRNIRMLDVINRVVEILILEEVVGQHHVLLVLPLKSLVLGHLAPWSVSFCCFGLCYLPDFMLAQKSNLLWSLGPFLFTAARDRSLPVTFLVFGALRSKSFFSVCGKAVVKVSAVLHLVP